MANVLAKLKVLLQADNQNLKTGTVQGSNEDGGFNVSTASGTTHVVFGDMEKGDLILFESDKLVQKLKRATLQTFYII